MQKINQNEVRIKKVTKRKVDVSYVCTSSRRVMKIHPVGGFILNYSIRANQYFPEPYEFDLSNYATKAGLKGAIDIDTSTLASETDLASFKTKEKKEFVA